MWSDTQILLLILAALYLGECLVWIPAQGLLLAAAGRRWTTRTSDGGFGNRGGAFRPISLLPWDHRGLLWIPDGCACGPEGVVAFLADQPGRRPRPAQTGIFLTWPEAAALTRRDRTLRHGDRVFLKARHETAARRILERLHDLAALPAAEREARLRSDLRAPLDPVPAAERLAAARAAARPLTILATLLFTYCFVFAPAVGVILGPQRALLGLFAGALLFHLPLLALFPRAHRRVAPGRRAERWTEFAKLVLSPPMAMRAADLVWLHGLEGLHPLAVLAAEKDDAGLRALGRALLLDHRHPLGLEECPAPAAATEAWHRREWVAALEERLRAEGLDPDALARPAGDWEPGTASYCCRCQQGYATGAETCSDCRLPLLPAARPQESRPCPIT